MSLPVIAWISFSSLGMLGWAAAAVIPVIIHLLRRRRKAAVPWAAMQLLRVIVERESRRVNLQRLLLLLLRVAILLVFALALSQPYLNRQADGTALIPIRSSKVWIFVIDTSYSMGYQAGELTRMDRAKQQAAKIIRESQPGDAFSLIALDQPARAIVDNPTYDSQSILNQVQNLIDNARGSDVVSALNLAGQIANTVRTNPQMPQDVEVVVLTDLGEDAWHRSSTEPVEPVLKRLGQSAIVTIKPIIDAQTTNVAVELVQPLQKRVVVGRPLTVEVSIANYGQSMLDMPVELVWNDQILSTESVDIDAGGRAKVLMTFTPSRSGSGKLSIVTPKDNLPIDNCFDLVLDVRPHFRVLVIDSKVDELNPWLLALQPDRKQSDLGIQGEVSLVSEQQWQRSKDTDWDVVVANDADWNSIGPLTRLDRFVQTGGCLIVTLGKNLTTISAPGGASTNDKKSELERLLGFRIQRPSDVGDWMIDPLGYQSPIIKVFEGFPNSGLLTTPLYRFWEIEYDEPSLNIDLALTSGQPLSVHRVYGSGYVVSLLSAPEDGRGTGGDASWNAIAAWPSFLPLVQQMVQVFYDNHLENINKTAGQPLTGQFRSAPTSKQLTLVRPDGTEIQLPYNKSENGSLNTWTYESTDQRGVYQVTEPDNKRHTLAVNVDPVQSSLSSVDSDTLQIPANPAPTIQRDKVLEPPSVKQLWTMGLLLFLGTLLIAESLTAWALGRQDR